ncbi:MAG: DUF1015 family protein [Chitinophagales bacterium]|nr:DUF1015 family protein [Chitinophagales bacterium]
MATIRPFQAFRPRPELAAQVACLPYDVMSTEEAREEAKDNPLSWLQVERAEIAFPASHDPYDKSVYEKAAERFQALVDNGTFSQDPTPYLYVYRQIMGSHSQTGLVALSSAKDYWDDVIKKHEFTRPVKEQDRINHMKTTGIHSGPVFLTYPDLAEINEIVEQVKQAQPDTDITAPDGVQHTIWIIKDQNTLQRIVQLFSEKVPFTYIADGHHRAASSAKVAREMRENDPGSSGEENYNFFLSVLFPSSHMSIMDYNRVVKDLHGYSEEDFLERLEEQFTVTPKGKSTYQPEAGRHFGMYLNGNWYQLTAKEGSYDPNDPVNGLDVSILQNNVLDKLLGIADPRTDNRIDFIGGIRGLKELEKRVDSGDWKVAFALYPVTIEQLIRIADSGNVMPPKSTWFEPKLRSGLVVNKFK